MSFGKKQLTFDIFDVISLPANGCFFLEIKSF